MRKILSYLFPIIVRTYPSKINGTLEVTLLNGRKVLDTERTNYSYGSVHRILRKGLAELPFDQNIKSVLVLGLGGGGIVQTIRETFKSEASITLVDIDPEIIFIAVNEFGITSYPGISIIQADAYDFIKDCRDNFDLIVVDIFIIDTIPAAFTQSAFLSALVQRLNARARLLYNTMRDTLDRDVFDRIITQLTALGLRIRVAWHVDHTNDLILGEKIAASGP